MKLSSTTVLTSTFAAFLTTILATPVAAPVPADASADVTAASAGAANIRNECTFPVYVVSCGSGACSSVQTLAAKTGTYAETFKSGSRSIKIAQTPPSGSTQTLQLEYVLEGTTNYYDWSEINGNAFVQYGFTTTSNNANCANVDCKAGATSCSSVYNDPNDNDATDTCPASSSIGVTLCSG